ncbi:LOW QUALITY PROTEIN: hypothetical protein RJ639_032804 [Escallonia herrerae]|uniref:FAR1 domain-containing protein n=1 Tax=Escallonia herrerae TaxID=1293975 RepID=A0AA88WVV6_9ASTE|nr:LOW QUALITY PROTEIN: hypothetical protein RJ639_032804 [Escallonia herrerae]
MASSSSQGCRANRIYRRWLAETFDGHEAAEEELSDSLNGNDGIVQPSVPTLPLSLEPLEPYVGMEFESAEDARDFYEMYGRCVGFTIRNNRTRRSLKDNSIIGRELYVQRKGFAQKNREEERTEDPHHSELQERGAVPWIAAKGGGKWVIYGFAKEHSHELNPSKIPRQRSHRIAFCENVDAPVQGFLSTRSRDKPGHWIDLGIFIHFLNSEVVISVTDLSNLVGLTYRCLLDEKDLKIRELSTELHRERKRSAIYQEQLQLILKYVEEHTQQLSLKVELVFENVRVLESEELDDADSD